MELDCFDCGACISAPDPTSLGEEFLSHAKAEHDWPFPETGIRNYAEATQRLTGPAERLDDIGTVEIHPVTDGRLDDWLGFFDHDAFVGKPEWASCYCAEPHRVTPGAVEADVPHWTESRAASADRLRTGATLGYLAYVDGRPAGWVNASLRSAYTLHPPGEDDPPGDEVIGVSCFIIAPPYRRHGIATALLDRVIADASARGAKWVEAYPFDDPDEGDDAATFRGPRAMFEQRGFQAVDQRERHTVMRRPAQ